MQESAAAYVTKLSSIVEAKNDVIGYVFAINDRINSADLYYSHDQFMRFWPKLLKTTAIEAVAERSINDPVNEKRESVSVIVCDNFARYELCRDVTLESRSIEQKLSALRRGTSALSKRGTKASIDDEIASSLGNIYES